MCAKRIGAKLLRSESELAGVASDGVGVCVGLKETCCRDHHVGCLVFKRPVVEGFLAFFLRVHHLPRDPAAVGIAFQVLSHWISSLPSNQGKVAIEASCGITVSIDLAIVKPASCSHVFRCMLAPVRPIDESAESLLEGRHSRMRASIKRES